MTVTAKRRYVAVDLGSETGRVVVGTIENDGIELQEIHRFPNAPVRLPDGLHVNVLEIFAQVARGIELALATSGAPIVSVGVDSWGVDYGLLDETGRLIGLPYFYRDARTDGVNEAFAQRVSPQEQYERTGIAPLSINTLYQLAAQARDDRLLQHADAFLMISDIMHFWLSGERAGELTNASTTGALGVDGTWAADLIAAAGVPRRLFAAPAQAATVLGPMRAGVLPRTGPAAPRVVVPATHDTACAVVAAPLGRVARDETCAYISSGTWSLLGLEISAPILTPAARQAGFTNELGIGGTVRFLRNIMGLWLVQECRRSWRHAGSEFRYDDLTARAAQHASPGVVIDVDDAELLHPADMPAALAAQLVRSGQRPLDDPVALTRAIFEGLALRYRHSLADAKRLSGARVGAIAIVGGGARNAPLCQLTADACGLVVYAGSAEASAAGNVLVQAIADNMFSGLAEIRAFIAATGEVRTYEPRSGSAIDWAAREARLLSPVTEGAVYNVQS